MPSAADIEQPSEAARALRCLYNSSFFSSSRNRILATKLIKSTALVGCLTLLSRILGFVRDMVVARAFGADAATDAFFVAFRIPNFFRRLFAEGSFSQAFVPVLMNAKQEMEPAEIRGFLDRTAGSFALILGAITALGLLGAPMLVLLFAPGFWDHPEQFDLAVGMVRITLPYLFFISLAALAGGILNAWSRFAVPAFTPVLLNLAMIATALWVAPNLAEPVTALAYGVVAGGLLQLAFQAPALLRLGLMPRLRYGLRDPKVRRILSLMGPAVFGVSVPQLNIIVNTVLASFLASGSLSWLYYSDRLVEFPAGIFGAAISTTILPHLAKTHVDCDGSGFSGTLDWALRWVVLLGLPASLGLALLSEPLMASLFEYDEFSARDTEMAARSLLSYAIGLMGLFAIKVLVPGFSARQDLGTPVRIGLISVATNLAFGLVLAPTLSAYGWGHGGLALAASLAAFCNAGLLLRELLKRGIYRPAPGWAKFLGRILLASVAMSLALAPAADWDAGADSGKARALGLSLWIIGAAVVYVGCLAATGLRPRHVVMAENPEAA